MPSSDGQILRNLRSHLMTAADFRRIALSLEGVEEYSHPGLPAHQTVDADQGWLPLAVRRGSRLQTQGYPTVKRPLKHL